MLTYPEDASGGEHFATESARMLFLESRVFLLPMVGEEGFGGEGLWAAVANIRKVREVFVLGVMVRPYLKKTVYCFHSSAFSNEAKAFDSGKNSKAIQIR